MKKANNLFCFSLLLCALSVLLLCAFLGGCTPACVHEPSDWIVDKNPTCSEEGQRHKECTLCHTPLETVSIAKAKHTEVLVPAIDATCTESGLTAGKVCSVCNATLIAQEIIPAKEHSEITVPGKASTCTEAGLSDGKKCSVCGEETLVQQALPIGDHVAGDWIVDRAATADEEGHKHKQCLGCEKTLATEAIPTVPANHVHEGDSWSIVLPATCQSEGEKQLLCVCGVAVETEPIAVIPHTEQILPAVAASCKSTGLTEGKKCSSCGKTLVKQSVTAKTGHEEQTVPGIAAGCGTFGLTEGKRCTVCTSVTLAQMPVPPTGHNFVEGTCKNCGISETYGLWIVDGLGNPVSDIIVKILQDGEQLKMYPYKGEFLALDLESGTYQIELDLSQCGEQYVFDEAACVLTPEKKNVTVRLFKTVGEPTELYVGEPLSIDYPAYFVGVGAAKVPLTLNDYTFFIFEPTDAAVYTITYECDSNLAISYHGGSFFVQGVDLTGSSEVKKYENGISISVYASSLGGSYVIGVYSSAASSCILSIRNAGDPGTRIEDAPWTPYLEDENKVAADLAVKPSGTYTTVDLTDLSLTAIYNEEDGYYHLGSADGPILFIDLTSSPIYVSSIQIICANQRMGTYIYDDNGGVIEKRSYNELFHQYGMPEGTAPSADGPTRVPLTRKLAEAIQIFGDKNGWWTPDAASNIFTQALLGAPYNREFAWLLFCGYYA